MPGVGPGMTESTCPSSTGANAVLSAPVLWSNATMPWLATAVDDPCWVALVNEPPATIWVPAWAIEKTTPPSMFGV